MIDEQDGLKINLIKNGNANSEKKKKKKILKKKELLLFLFIKIERDKYNCNRTACLIERTEISISCERL